MRLTKNQISDQNKSGLDSHQHSYDFLTEKLTKNNHDVNQIIEKIRAFQVAIPSWALGAGGTRFGRFSFYGEPSNLEKKI
jgi:L-rhamnose isomerase/sugar isomerase